jgi:CBS domain-containing protein
MMNEPVSSIMTRNLITVGKDDSLQVIGDIFSSHRIHHIPVVENDELIGLVTTYDLFKSGKSKSDYGSTKVSEVMTTKLATLESNSKVGTACEVFLENLFHALPITDGKKLVGIVTSFDVLKYVHRKEYPNQEILSPMVKKD